MALRRFWLKQIDCRSFAWANAGMSLLWGGIYAGIALVTGYHPHRLAFEALVVLPFLLPFIAAAGFVGAYVSAWVLNQVLSYTGGVGLTFDDSSIPWTFRREPPPDLSNFEAAAESETAANGPDFGSGGSPKLSQ